MAQGCPRNLAGRYYNGGNLFMLLLLTEYKRYKTPIFLTYKQAQDEEINVKKGENRFRFISGICTPFPKTKKTEKACHTRNTPVCPTSRKRLTSCCPCRGYYSVFNIDQTDMPEKNPERYARLLEQAAGMPQTDGTTCAEVDHMVDAGKWYCRIEVLESDSAFYRPSADIIVCPLKTQFPKGADYYSTLLHEVAHSTGHPSRLNRICPGFSVRPAMPARN
ncbi:MAG: zincin-like metallopeptidase domain-containing protein [Alistipes finegoldii]